MRHLVVARYKEDTAWTDQLTDWRVIIIQKETEELKGDIPNAGREPASFLYAIGRHYDEIKPTDVWAFVQGRPFDHCPNFMDKLDHPVTGYVPLGGDTPKTCDDSGRPDHPNLPVKEKFEAWLGQECPRTLKFHAGGQFMCTGRELLRYPRDWYVTVMDDTTTAWNAWVWERIWGYAFAPVLQSKQTRKPARVIS